MRKIVILFLTIIGLLSLFVTIVDIFSNRYFRELQNLKSFSNKKLYMEVDSLLVQSIHGRNAALNDHIRFDINGILKSSGEAFEINARSFKYTNIVSNYQLLYKSKLSNEYFIKADNEEYYQGIKRGMYFSIFLKVYLIFAIFLGIYYFKKNIK